ncbi:hypothetical protein VNO78_15880 [Psophocarpus tetragonolobus]|uniref:Secreted protein n=1 Tax=Psophocarpus tetragonolobus TaxID=3891 RepID=A0AAN9SGU8_PSOTE
MALQFLCLVFTNGADCWKVQSAQSSPSMVLLSCPIDLVVVHGAQFSIEVQCNSLIRHHNLRVAMTIRQFSKQPFRPTMCLSIQVRAIHAKSKHLFLVMEL